MAAVALIRDRDDPRSSRSGLAQGNPAADRRPVSAVDVDWPGCLAGAVEESYFSCSYSPIADSEVVVGVLLVSFETTERVPADAGCALFASWRQRRPERRARRKPASGQPAYSRAIRATFPFCPGRNGSVF